MKKTLLLLFVCGMFLTSCAGMSLETKRFVKNNNFYSSQFPNLTISVNESLEYISDKSSNDFREGTAGIKSTSIGSKWYYFRNRGMMREFNIHLETLTEKRWRMSAPDYSKEKYPILSGKETLSGIEFYTGIFVVPRNNYSLLIKAYGKTSGEKVRFQMFYFEHVGNEWLTNPVLYSSQQREYLAAFKGRAGESFTVSDYSEPAAVSVNTPIAQVSTREEDVLTTKERFQTLQDLYKSGLMTEEEYQAKRKEIMREL